MSEQELEYVDLRDEFIPDTDDLDWHPDLGSTGDRPEPDFSKLTAADLDDFFGPDGTLAQQLDGYEARPSQLEMAKAIKRAILARGHALMEAPTGTGKSIAYLVPALLSGQRVVVATANKSLQSQLYEKDIPFLQSVMGRNIDAVLVKGRSNFVCLHKWAQEAPIREQMAFYDTEDRQIRDLTRWLNETDTGDVDDLSFNLTADLRPRVVSYPDDCLHDVCTYYGDCFVEKMRDRAAEAQVLITNHHLLLNALELGFAGHRLLPPADLYIVDEAHQLEQIATSVFETTVTDFSVEQILTRKVLRDTLGEDVADEISAQNLIAFQQVSHLSRDNSYQIEGPLDGLHQLGKRLEDVGRILKERAERLAARGEQKPLSQEEAEELRAFQLTVEVTNSTANKLLTVATDKHDGDYVRYVSRIFDRRKVTLEIHAAPINPAEQLAKFLFHAEEDGESLARTVVCTSATLATGGAFDHFKRQCGIQATAEEQVLPTVFDYPKQALLYQPSLPAYNYRSPQTYYDAAAAEIERLLEVSRGRALCLFTSWSGLEQVAQRLRDADQPSVWPIRAQGDAPRNALLDWFKRTPHSVLLATRSFWEGVDIPGDDLSLVVLDKMPFPTPGDPLHGARMRAVEEKGESSFGKYMLPMMTLALKQGFGRLVRRSSDRGVVAILDERLTSKAYGRQVRQDLPPARFSREFRDVHKFYQTTRPQPAEFAVNLWLDEDSDSDVHWRWQVLRLQDGRADEASGVWRDLPREEAARRAGALALGNLRERIERAGHTTDRYGVEIRIPEDVHSVLAQTPGSNTPSHEWTDVAGVWQAIDFITIDRTADNPTPL
jgi:ATP-dependent DNA helicase DinG